VQPSDSHIDANVLRILFYEGHNSQESVAQKFWITAQWNLSL